MQRGLELLRALQAGLGLDQSSQLPPGCSEAAPAQPASRSEPARRAAKVSAKPSGRHTVFGDDPEEDAQPAPQPAKPAKVSL